ncbi:MAG: hypothetical protein HUJ54_07745 [Erysipelotrichaceae bacterium]|nr:hypothetical protein [Erysipelotrichaceae bacterium]
MEDRNDKLPERLSLREAALFIGRKALMPAAGLFFSLGIVAAVTVMIRNGMLENGIVPMVLCSFMIIPAAGSMLLITVYSNALSDLIENCEDDTVTMKEVRSRIQEQTREVLGKGWHLPG